MSVFIKLTFPGGRYHATPWGRHVNEGVAEWPPSPWRLLRALIAVWKRTCSDLPEEQMRRILGTLTSPPKMRLPAFRFAHTRHYMPWEKKGPGDRALVFDTFVAVGRSDPLFVGWPDAELSNASDRIALSRLLENLSSLGRAESWVEASLHQVAAELCLGEASSDDPNPIAVLCADPSTAFAETHYPKFDPKKLEKGKINPSDFLFDCPRWHLCLDTETINTARWSSVPGAKWVNYTRPAERRMHSSKPFSPVKKKPTIARFVLDGKVLPLLNDTIRVADAFRNSAMSQFRKHCERHAEQAVTLRTGAGQMYASHVFSGKNSAGVKLQTHGHAHFLPTASANDPRHIDQVTIYAPDGFGPFEIAALNRIRKVYVGELPCAVQITGLGTVSDFNHSIFGISRTWKSLTPFIAHRHAKSRGQRRDIPTNPDDPKGSFLSVSIRELCELRELPPLVSAMVIEPGTGKLRHFHYLRDRRKPGDDAQTRTSGFLSLEFKEPISGPLCLGYNCHFGMGLFMPTDRE